MESVRQTRKQRGQRQHVGARRSQLERERQTVQLPADLRHHGRIALGQGQIRPDRADALHEEIDRVGTPQALQRGRVLGRQRHRRDRKPLLALQMQRHPARGQRLEPRASFQQARDHRRRGDDLFKVVQQQKQLKLGEMLNQPCFVG